MRLYELFERAGLKAPADVENVDVKNIVTDSRRVQKDSLFVCIRGTHTDGHEYIDSAIEKGASVIVAEQVRDACVGGAAAFIMLDNTRKVAALLYNAFFGDPVKNLKIIGVTGTNGKTSVTYLLYEIFRRSGFRTGLIGTVCRLSADGADLSPKNEDPTANMTTPDPDELYRELAEMVKDGVEYVFMEVSSHSLALGKVEAIEFDSAVFTNLTQDHLDFHGSMDEYYKAKSRLFEKSRRALINIGGEYGKRLALECPCPFFTCSVTEGDFRALDVKGWGTGGVSYILKSPYGELWIESPMMGSIAVENTLTAGALALTYGISPKTVSAAIAEIQGAAGRMEKVDIETDEFSVIIDYAHTPDALEKLLRTVRSIRPTGGHIILVFGCGGERDGGKRKLMGGIASRFSDLVIVTSDNSRGEDPDAIISDILKGIDKEKPYTVIKDRREAIARAVLDAKYGDVVVLAGKGHEKYEINAEGKHPFDETKIVKSAFALRQERK
ncbi:MAG: UDP-N-acetylmuramoyl-L-alanyl-D-glutamate--2,6-diaminopimelate ligase [Clostridia bacterium]|nr:UDP-N-acetylmuramoyl-L-alanyl-D-glutamate--2,6-diaminopimelate ligase [Clostridia bacterium]